MDSSLDWFLAIMLAVVSVTFFLGKGDGLLQMFDGKRGNNRKNWSEEKVLKYKRALAVFTGCLAIAEFLLALLAAVYPAVVWGVLALGIGASVWMIVYCRKNF